MPRACSYSIWATVHSLAVDFDDHLESCFVVGPCWKCCKIQHLRHCLLISVLVLDQQVVYFLMPRSSCTVMLCKLLSPDCAEYTILHCRNPKYFRDQNNLCVCNMSPMHVTMYPRVPWTCPCSCLLYTSPSPRD